jgi:hypothetical protein
MDMDYGLDIWRWIGSKRQGKRGHRTPVGGRVSVSVSVSGVGCGCPANLWTSVSIQKRASSKKVVARST